MRICDGCRKAVVLDPCQTICDGCKAMAPEERRKQFVKPVPKPVKDAVRRKGAKR